MDTQRKNTRGKIKIKIKIKKRERERELRTKSKSMNRTNVNYKKRDEKRDWEKKWGLQEMHLIGKGDVFIPAWIAFTNVTNLNRPSSENHLSFHVGEPEVVFALSTSLSFFPALPGRGTDVAHARANVTHQLSLASTTWKFGLDASYDFSYFPIPPKRKRNYMHKVNRSQSAIFWFIHWFQRHRERGQGYSGLL